MNPKFSVVVPLFRVEEYIGDLLDSFQVQTLGNYTIEYIFIDDGSPDRSGDIVEEWILRTKLPATLVRQSNQGVSAARNHGIRLATGDWITFPDSDDFLSRDYFKNVADFLIDPKASDVTIVAANIIRYFDKDKLYRDSHALNFKFRRGNAVVDIEQNPSFIQLSAPTTFYRTAQLNELSVEFRVGLHASEDALFTSEVLLSEEKPKLGVVQNAKYFYRKRASEDSAVDGFRKNPNSYFERFEVGYLYLLEQAAALKGHIPRWLVSIVLYEYRWLFTYENNLRTRATILTDAQREEFVNLTKKILSYITPGQIEDYRITPMQYEVRLVLQALAGEKFPNQGVRVVATDTKGNLLKISYWYSGQRPTERFLNYGREVIESFSKDRALDYFGQKIMRERIVWLPISDQLEVELDGIPARLNFGLPALRDFQISAQRIKGQFRLDTSDTLTLVATKKGFRTGVAKLDKLLSAVNPIGMETPRDSFTRILRSVKRRLGKLVRTRRAKVRAKENVQLRKNLSVAIQESGVVGKYDRAWLLMDRVDAAGDNAEHLYRYLSQTRSDIKVWFVLKRDSKDWQRLEGQGFKLLDYGSFEFQKALCLAQHFISSHADVEMTDPMPIAAYPQRRRPWEFSFLQHGVTQNDLSLWLNPKRIDRVFTTTYGEHKSICADDSPYVFGERETFLTGMPRHDSLLTRAQGVPTKKYILISPTWRHFLVKPKKIGSGKREPATDFYASDFYESWIALLKDPRIFEVAKHRNLELAFLPHPNLEEAMADIDLDPRIHRLSYRNGDIQEVFAESAVLITDYSSIAFDLAFVGAEVHYFQFDRADMFGGMHTMARGYFDYESDAFGPIHLALESLFESNEESIWAMSLAKATEYRSRMESAFVYHDAQSSERVVNALELADQSILDGNETE